MKKLTLISIFIFWAIIVAVLAAGMIVGNKNIGVLNIPVSAPGMQSGQQQTGTSAANQAATGLTLQEVSTHNSISNCWSIVNNKVYNLTNFLTFHSGGAGAILPYCGKDGTNAFNTKDSSPARSHRQGDSSILQNYYVGDLGQSVSQGTIQNIASTTKTVNFPKGDDD